MKVARWEAFIEKHMDDFLHRGFSRELEPSQVERAIEREIMSRRKKSPRGNFVPNAFAIEVSTGDYQRLSSRRFMEDLHVYIEKLLILADVYMDDRLQVQLMDKSDIEAGACRISSWFASASEGSPQDLQQGTLVLARSSFAVPLNLPSERKLASITVTKGPDENVALSFGEHKLFMGRRDKNEFILTDKNVSRLHAYIDYERHRHVLHDADSLNGTYVNGARIEEIVLQDGDEIVMGSNLLIYEVL